jgi:hypothetical protein
MCVQFQRGTMDPCKTVRGQMLQRMGGNGMLVRRCSHMRSRQRVQRRDWRCCVHAGSEHSEGPSKAPDPQSTIAGIDALLGIDEEEEKRKQVRDGPYPTPGVCDSERWTPSLSMNSLVFSACAPTLTYILKKFILSVLAPEFALKHADHWCVFLGQPQGFQRQPTTGLPATRGASCSSMQQHTFSTRVQPRQAYTVPMAYTRDHQENVVVTASSMHKSEEQQKYLQVRLRLRVW